ncbi:MAG: 30S ribosome-binding factor RbfA [Firmicutes bacterium]|nr:30S ribosome-binding factor RbfA [Bacillota bacterium]
MGKGYRPDRIGEEIRKIISDMLLHGLKDPRLDSMISITAVDVTSDYSYATVYFTVLGMGAGTSEEALEDVIAGFESSKGFIRKRVGSELRLKHTPELIFKVDHSLEYGRHIDEIIETLEYSDDNIDGSDGNNE